jgi:predicted acyl esterase
MAPATEAFEICGEPLLAARTRCDRGGHDLVAVLSVVGLDGTPRAVSATGARNVGDAARARSAGVDDGNGDGTQGGATTFAWLLRLRPIAVRVRPGECLRLSLSASRFPCYDRHPARAGCALGPQVATVTLDEATISLPLTNLNVSSSKPHI